VPSLTLPLLVLRVALADDADHALALDHLAVLTDRFDARTYLHKNSPKRVSGGATKYRPCPGSTQGPRSRRRWQFHCGEEGMTRGLEHPKS
jgi:hypothetical protein